ncbi:MAG: hypothetical protein AAFS04_18445 [Cyanobacteria bacterium J06631_9]
MRSSQEINHQEKKVPMPVDSQAPDTQKIADKIQLLGLPGKPLENGSHSKNESVNNFFKDLIAKEIAQGKSELSDFDFDGLEVWLHRVDNEGMLTDAQMPATYTIPDLSQGALTLKSPVSNSELSCIYVVDNGFLGEEYEAWRMSCETLLVPLFQRFVSPNSPPDILKEFIAMRFGVVLARKLTLYLDMKNNIFFNALIVKLNAVSLTVCEKA